MGTLESHNLQERLEYNIWVQLAKIANVSDLYLAQKKEIKYILGSCLILVCKDPAPLSNYTIVSTIPNEIVTYADYPNRGPPTLQKPDNAV